MEKFMVTVENIMKKEYFSTKENGKMVPKMDKEKHSMKAVSCVTKVNTYKTKSMVAGSSFTRTVNSSMMGNGNI